MARRPHVETFLSQRLSQDAIKKNRGEAYIYIYIYIN